MLTKSSEEYLKNIYLIQNKNGSVRVTDIAKVMNVTKASVNKAIYILKDENMVSYEPYGTLKLTETGIKEAKKILQAYDIVKVFLKDVIGIDKEKVEKEAESMKASLSDDSINKVAKYTYEVLGLGSLNCCFDINKEKCWTCKKVTKRKTRALKLKKGM